MTKTSILFRSDDAGISLSANVAMEAVLRAGIVRNVSWMACAPEAGDAAERLRKTDGEVCVGLHATITSEWDNLRWSPVSGADRVPSLVREDGTFHPTTAHLHNKFHIDHVETEIRAQINLARQYGLDLTYIDTHMGFDWLPGIADLLAKIGREKDLVVSGDCPLKPLPEATRLAAVADPARTEVFSSIESGHYLWFFHPLTEDTPSMRLACKPDVALEGERIAETRFLTSPSLAESLRTTGICSISYPFFRTSMA